MKVQLDLGTKVQEVKTHLHENKQYYLAGGAALLTGLVIGRISGGRPIQIAPVFNNTNTNNNVANATATAFAGRMHKVVKCNDTNDIWETVYDAAKAAGVPRTVMSKHINGHTDHINGATYSIIGVGTRN